MDVPTPARQPTQSLHAIVRLSRAFEAHLGEQLTVNPTDLAAMEHLISSGPLGATELARRLSLTPQAVTAVVDRLQELGHASRMPNPDDRRAVVVTPAPASVARAMSYLMPMIGDIDASLDGFDDEQRAVIGEYLDRVVVALSAHLPPDAAERQLGPDSIRP